MDNDQLIFTLEIRSADFIRDVKHAFAELMKSGGFPDLGMRRIDQAVHAGFGFFTAEQGLAALNEGPVQVEIDDAAFRKRVEQLAQRKRISGDVAPGVFIANVHQCLMDSVVEGSACLIFNGRLFPAMQRAPGLRQRPLKDAMGNITWVPIPERQLRNAASWTPEPNPIVDWAVEQGRLLQEAIRSGEFKSVVS